MSHSTLWHYVITMCKESKKKAIYEAMGRMQECSSQVVESIEGYNAVCWDVKQMQYVENTKD